MCIAQMGWLHTPPKELRLLSALVLLQEVNLVDIHDHMFLSLLSTTSTNMWHMPASVLLQLAQWHPQQMQLSVGVILVSILL
jgi:hypothetical protein